MDTFPEGTDDDLLFEYAAKNERVLVTCDKKIQLIADRWLEEGRSFRMVTWKQEHYRRMSDGDFIRKFEARAEMDDAFPFPIINFGPD